MAGSVLEPFESLVPNNQSKKFPNLASSSSSLGDRGEGHRGPLQTQAKSRDHEIVGAQEKVSKGRPNTPPKSCSVRGHKTLKCSVKSYVTGPSTKCYFKEFIFMWVLTHDKLE